MNEKLPYYMAYPMPFSFDDERIERMDLEYLKSMYPKIPKRILPYVEEECDRMECENSMVYDAYPDKLQLKLMCTRVCDNIRRHEHICREEDEKEEDLSEDEAITMENLRDLVEVMLFQELYKRRCDHRRCCRRFFK